MVLLVLTDRIRSAVHMALASPDFDSSAKDRLRTYLKGSVCLPLDLVKEVSKFLVNRDGKIGNEMGLSHYWLHELLTGSGVYVESEQKIKSKTPKNPELMARLESILAEQANKEYARMIGRVASSYDVETFKLLDTEEFSSIRGQLTAIINITFTVVSVFAAVYHVAQNITGDTGMRILLAGFGSLLVGTAETFLYMRYLAGYDKKKQKDEKVRKPVRRHTCYSTVTVPVKPLVTARPLVRPIPGVKYPSAATTTTTTSARRTPRAKTL